MDLDSFFGTPKWRILELLAEKPLSPSELSDGLGTSIAYVSQQLKLLEALGLISKQKTGSADKGKPRSLYSLSKEILSIAVLSNGWSSKRNIALTDHHKLILRIWMLENSSLHYHLEKVYWEIERYIDEINAIFFSDANQELIVVSDSKGLKTKLNVILKDHKRFIFLFLSKEEFVKKSLKNIFPIFDPNNLTGGLTNEI